MVPPQPGEEVPRTLAEAMGLTEVRDRGKLGLQLCPDGELGHCAACGVCALTCVGTDPVATQHRSPVIGPRQQPEDEHSFEEVDCLGNGAEVNLAGPEIAEEAQDNEIQFRRAHVFDHR